MNLLLKICLPVLIITQSVAQNSILQSKKWILLNDRIEKNDIHLASYSPSKLKTDSFVIRFAEDGKIEYDYETGNPAKTSSRTVFLDIDTHQSSWQYDASLRILTLVLKGGYTSLADFNFKRSYKVEPSGGGYLLRVLSEQYTDNLKSSLPTQPAAASLIVKETSEKPAENISQPLVNDVKERTKKTDARARTKAMLMPGKRWILVGNKIAKNAVRLTSFDASKFRINTLVLSFGADGKIVYDYESDPELEFCPGIEFLDIDTEESAWALDEENNVITLTIKGGYASLDDFKFKRDYKIEQSGDEYVLHKIHEHYFIDLKKERREGRR